MFGAIFANEGQVAVFRFNQSLGYRDAFPHLQDECAIANCAELGVLPTLPSLVASVQANEVLKIVLGKRTVLSVLGLETNFFGLK